MPVVPDDPLHRIAVNLYRADVEAMRKLYGQGWSAKVRELVRTHLSNRVKAQEILERLEDDDEHVQ